MKVSIKKTDKSFNCKLEMSRVEVSMLIGSINYLIPYFIYFNYRGKTFRHL